MRPELAHQIVDLANQASGEAIRIRRDLHAHPEVGFTELRTASLVARRLQTLGYLVQAGRSVVADEARLGVPPEAELARHYERALADGADPEFVEMMRGGFTGVIGELTGGLPGPTIALRMDMDALPIQESPKPEHAPARSGFASQYQGVMHACGHDGHTAIGLGVAEVLAQMRPYLAGTVRLLFQPAEEGCRGAYSMMRAGAVENVDIFLGFHLGLDAPSGWVYPELKGFLASTKLDVTFRGRSAHAGVRPEEGRSALICAAQAAVGLHAIPRHSGGASRINVGVLRAGAGRNIIADHAYLMLETRGATTEIDEYLVQRATALIEGTAQAHGCSAQTTIVGRTIAGRSDPTLISAIAKAAALVPGLHVANEPLVATGSEDATYFMQRVQAQGGLAAYLCLGTDIPTGHHTATFDIQERDFAGGIAVLALTIAQVGLQPSIGRAVE